MRIAVLNAQVPFISGGAEILASNLVNALREAGHQAELVTLPFKWYPARTLLDHMTMARLVDLTESNGNQIDRVIGLKFPAYLVPHPCKVLWLLHQHRTAYDLWNHPRLSDLILDPEGMAVRDAIHEADRRWIPEAQSVYTISQNVSTRLRKFCDIESRPLYHPPGHADRFYTEQAEPFLFFPSRINPIKRQSLVIEALALTRHPVRVVFAGVPDDPTHLVELERLCLERGVADRIEWRGRISDEDKLALYARCLGVVYPPLDEDYGYVTLEAMLARKPVITTHDSGGPLEFIEERKSGLAVESTPRGIAAAMDELWSDFPRAARWGDAGRAIYESLGITWQRVVDSLLA
jgi:glycosyltransferase involved in cell wall biosynthesis